MTIEDDVIRIAVGFTLKHYPNEVARELLIQRSSNPESPEHYNNGAIRLAEDIVVDALKRVMDSDSCTCSCKCC